MFDILSFLQDEEIDYRFSGDKNITITCLFCDDSKYHLGILISNPNAIYCWKCGKHTLRELIQEIVGEDYHTREFYNKYGINSLPQDIQKNKEEPPIKIKMPGNEITNYHINYLKKRGFKYAEIEYIWKIKGTLTDINYPYRIMIPIYFNKKLVSFQGRDITGKHPNKYKAAGNINIKNYLYGIDHIHEGNIIFVVEGIFDVWRLGQGNAVCTFGIQTTQKQTSLLYKKKVKKVITFFDHGKEAQHHAKLMRHQLKSLDIKCANLLPPKDKDPADMNPKETQKALSWLQ